MLHHVTASVHLWCGVSACSNSLHQSNFVNYSCLYYDGLNDMAVVTSFDVVCSSDGAGSDLLGHGAVQQSAVHPAAKR